MDLSVVIITCNEAPRLRFCLAALEQACVYALERSRVALEVLIIDDASADETPEVCASARLPVETRYERNVTRAGRSASRNRGGDLARGEVLLFLDGDTLVSRTALLAHLDFHAKESGIARGETFNLRQARFLRDPDAGEFFEGHSSRAVRADELVKLEWVKDSFDEIERRAQPGIYPGSIPRLLAELECAALRAPGRAHSLWMTVSAHNISIRKEPFSSVGGFNEHLTLNEHRELALRLEIRLGLAVRLLEECRSYHLCHSTTWRDPLVSLDAWEPFMLASYPRNDVRLLSFFWLSLAGSSELPPELRIATIEELIERSREGIAHYEEFRRSSPLFSYRVRVAGRQTASDSMLAVSDRNAQSLFETLVEECVLMGWPYQPEEGRAVVAGHLADAGITNTGGEKIDLYAALNRVRIHGWSNRSEIWKRYVSTRRREVEAHHSPREIHVSLCRTIPVTREGASQRLRLPLPLQHPAQPDTRWRVIDVDGELLEQRQSPGALDLVIRSDKPRVNATIEYFARLTPQEGPQSANPSDISASTLSAPFQVPEQLRLDRLSGIAARSERDRVRVIWDTFQDQLLSGSIYHHEHLVSAAPLAVRDRRWFDCVAGTWLFAMTTQALGLPTRVLSGLILQSYGPSQHYWCEVFFEGGWQPFDLYAWDLADGASEWRNAFFGRLECRLRFECLPAIHARFLPNRAWFIERSLHSTGTRFLYRGVDSGELLGKDEWSVSRLEDALHS